MPRSATKAYRKTKRPSPKRAKSTAPKKPQRTAAKIAKRTAPKKTTQRSPNRLTLTSQKKAKQTSVAATQARIEALEAELRNSRDEQAAAAEILQFINSSPGELRPVFDVILEKAMRLCDASFGGLWLFESSSRYVSAALRGVPDAYAKFLTGTTEMPGPG